VPFLFVLVDQQQRAPIKGSAELRAVVGVLAPIKEDRKGGYSANGSVASCDSFQGNFSVFAKPSAIIAGRLR